MSKRLDRSAGSTCGLCLNTQCWRTRFQVVDDQETERKRTKLTLARGSHVGDRGVLDAVMCRLATVDERPLGKASRTAEERATGPVPMVSTRSVQ
jgi:hypothetical protein